MPELVDGNKALAMVLDCYVSKYSDVVLSCTVQGSHVRFINYNELCRNTHFTHANCFLSLNIDEHTRSHDLVEVRAHTCEIC